MSSSGSRRSERSDGLIECGTVSVKEKWNVIEIEREVESTGQ